MTGSSGKIVSLLSRMKPRHWKARERLPCAKLTLGIDPRRTDSEVGAGCSSVAQIYAREGYARAKEGLR